MHNAPLAPEELDFLEAILLNYGNDDSVLDIAELDGFLPPWCPAPRSCCPAVGYRRCGAACRRPLPAPTRHRPC